MKLRRRQRIVLAVSGRTSERRRDAYAQPPPGRLPRCTREYAAIQRTQQLLAELGPKKAPADLALKLRVAISQQVAEARRPRYEGLLVRIENALNAFMVPATAGLVSAVLIFGLLLGFFALPGQLQASSGDVP